MMGLREWLIRKFGGKPRKQYGGEMRTYPILERLSRNVLEDIIVGYVMTPKDRSWFAQYVVEQHERERLESVLRSTYHTAKDLNHAKHMADLEEKCRRQGEEIRFLQDKAHEHNVTAYATGLIVNCTGCEAGKPFQGEELTEERVREVETIAKRLRIWFTNHKSRLEHAA